ncbi:hypothetical protein [Streptomyces sp. WM6372]|nr:hypothetical protein [Streptomyces sp. WM6372]
MTFTEEDLIWAATRTLGCLLGALLLCGIIITLTVAIAITIKKRINPPRQ